MRVRYRVMISRIATGAAAASQLAICFSVGEGCGGQVSRPGRLSLRGRLLGREVSSVRLEAGEEGRGHYQEEGGCDHQPGDHGQGVACDGCD